MKEEKTGRRGKYEADRETENIETWYGQTQVQKRGVRVIFKVDSLGSWRREGAVDMGVSGGLPEGSID